VDAGEAPPRPFPRVTPHDLRHTGHLSRCDAKAVQRVLGHASAAMTLDTYADLFDEDLDAVTAALDGAARAFGVARVLQDHDSGR